MVLDFQSVFLQQPLEGISGRCDRTFVFFRVKILEQFVDSVNQLKAQRHHTVHMHICAALCSLLQVLHCSSSVMDVLQ